MKLIQKLRGFKDNDKTENYNQLINIIKKIVKSYNITEVIVPSVENTNLFIKSIGDATDIVEKEMFNFRKSDTDYCLRPELTSSLVRYAIESDNYKSKLFTYGSCFRYERPQQGRFREFSQFDVEFFGNKTIYADYECLLCFNSCLEAFRNLYSLKIKLKINTIGSAEDRKNYNLKLKEYFSTQNLSETSKKRFEKGAYLRILDSKEDKFENVPSFLDNINSESKLRFENICKFLKSQEIEYEIDSKLVRGLDYYNDLVFEAAIDSDKSQNAIGGGGRFDNLFETFSNKNAAIGFAFGVDRLLSYISSSSEQITRKIGIIITDEHFDFIKLEPLRSKFIIEILGSDLRACLSYAVSNNYFGVIFTDLNKNYNFKNLQTATQNILSLGQILNL